MRILGEGGADAPSSGQDVSRGAGRRSGRFRPVHHFPSHSLQGTAGASACTELTCPSQALPYVFRTRSSQENAGGKPRAQRHRANECDAIAPTGCTVRRTGAPRGRIAATSPTTPVTTFRPARPAPRAPRRRRSHRCKFTPEYPRKPYAHSAPEQRFSANLAPLRIRWRPCALTPAPPAVLRCGRTRTVRSGVPAT